MRIAFVLAALGAGGAERVVAILCRAAIRRGWDVTIFAFDAPDAAVYHDFPTGVRLRRLDVPMAVGFAAAISVMQRVRILRREILVARIDVVLSFLTKINVIALLATRVSGVPVIVSERNNPRRQNTNPVWNLALRALYPHADAIVMQTDAARRGLPRSQRARATVIANPIERPRFTPQPSRPTVAAVGRLSRQKGFDLLIEAFARVADAHPDWQLVIWGEGGDRETLEAQALALGMAGRIAFPGNSAEPGSWIATATCYVLSSRYEGFPNALGEAMAAGLPVVAADCDFGPADMVDDGSNGLLAHCEDCESLAESMRQLMADPALRCRLGREAKVRSSRLNSDTIAQRWFYLAEATIKPTRY